MIPPDPKKMREAQEIISRLQPSLATLFALFREMDIQIFEVVVVPTMDVLTWRNSKNLPVTEIVNMPIFPMPISSEPNIDGAIPSPYFGADEGEKTGEGMV